MKPRLFYSRELAKPTTEKEGSDHDQYRDWQINQPIFNGSNKWKNELTVEEVAIIEQRADVMLRECGYK